MGKIVFNDNQRWVELNYKPQHLPSRLKMDSGNGDAVSERRKRKNSKERSSSGMIEQKKYIKKTDKEEYSGDEKKVTKILEYASRNFNK